MAAQNLLIMNLLRIITPEEIADIATKHNGGKFLSLTDLVTERFEQKIYRDFTSPNSIDEIHEDHAKNSKEGDQSAKILPFTKKNLNTAEFEEVETPVLMKTDKDVNLPSLTTMAIQTSQLAYQEEETIQSAAVEHKEDENMSTFILVEKARLKKSQKILKQREIIDLYQKNSHVDVEQIKNSNAENAQSTEAGVLVNKKQY